MFSAIFCISISTTQKLVTSFLHVSIQTWPTEAEMAEADRNHEEKKTKKKRRLPKGISDYQVEPCLHSFITFSPLNFVIDVLIRLHNLMTYSLIYSSYLEHFAGCMDCGRF